jgi:hypothetical protein
LKLLTPKKWKLGLTFGELITIRNHKLIFSFPAFTLKLLSNDWFIIETYTDIETSGKDDDDICLTLNFVPITGWKYLYGVATPIVPPSHKVSKLLAERKPGANRSGYYIRDGLVFEAGGLNHCDFWGRIMVHHVPECYRHHFQKILEVAHENAKKDSTTWLFNAKSLADLANPQ